LDATGRRLTLTYDPSILSLAALEAHVTEAGLALMHRFRHATLQLQGLDCPECAGAVEHSVTHVPGVSRAAANFAAASLYVEYDAEITDLDRIAAAVGRAGYRALVPGAASGVVVVRVAEMDCQDEVKAIEGALRSLPGVAAWQVNLLERTLRVQFDTADTGPEAILAAIRGLGMTPELTGRAIQAVAWRRDPLFLSTVTSGVCLGAALIMDWAGMTSMLGHVLHGMALCAGGWMAARKAVRAVLVPRLDMNVLMTVAVLGAIAIGQWDEAASVAFCSPWPSCWRPTASIALAKRCDGSRRLPLGPRCGATGRPRACRWPPSPWRNHRRSTGAPPADGIVRAGASHNQPHHRRVHAGGEGSWRAGRRLHQWRRSAGGGGDPSAQETMLARIIAPSSRLRHRRRPPRPCRAVRRDLHPSHRRRGLATLPPLLLAEAAGRGLPCPGPARHPCPAPW
jgi:copper ion binding protein